MRGLAAFKKKMAEDKASRGGRGAFIPEVDFKAGKVAVLQLVGPSSDEPYSYDAHRVAEKKQGRQWPTYKPRPCASGHEDHPEGCVLCYAGDAGDKRVGRASTRAAWQVLDCRFMHRVPLVKDGKVIQKNDGTGPFMVSEVCRGKACARCKHKDEKVRERKRAGYCRLDLSSMFVDSFISESDTIGEFCYSCWHADDDGPDGGTLTRIKFVCSECEADVPMSKFDPDADENFKCLKCKKVMVPREVVKCSNKCRDARRVTAWDGRWKVAKAGEGKQTAYTFTFMGVKPLEDWMDEELDKVIDLADYYKPLPDAAMAKVMGIRNPFAGGHTANHSESDDAEDYEEQDITKDSSGEDADWDEDVPF